MPHTKHSIGFSAPMRFALSCAAILLFVSGCATPLVHSDSYCALYAPVTDVTSAQTDENNAIWLEVCHGEDLTAEDE